MGKPAGLSEVVMSRASHSIAHVFKTFASMHAVTVHMLHLSLLYFVLQTALGVSTLAQPVSFCWILTGLCQP